MKNILLTCLLLPMVLYWFPRRNNQLQEPISKYLGENRQNLGSPCQVFPGQKSISINRLSQPGNPSRKKISKNNKLARPIRLSFWRGSCGKKRKIGESRKITNLCVMFSMPSFLLSPVEAKPGNGCLPVKLHTWFAKANLLNLTEIVMKTRGKIKLFLEELEPRVVPTTVCNANPTHAAECAYLNSLIPQSAITLTAKQSGNWSNPVTWGGRLPGNGDNMWIPNGITVTVDGKEPGSLRSILDNGTLQFATNV